MTLLLSGKCSNTGSDVLQALYGTVHPINIIPPCATPTMVQAKEFDSYITKYRQKSKICSDQQVDLVNFILESYAVFLLNMSPNSCVNILSC